jgi:hypothetical protein
MYAALLPLARMRYVRESFNNGADVFESNYPEHLEDIEAVLSETDYHVKHCNQDEREHELIFDPVGTNKFLQEGYEAKGWRTGVNLESPGYSGGRDIDLFKQPVAGEIQFSHYTSLDSDMNRLQRLYEDRLSLENGEDVEAGVVIVVVPDMPSSQSVSHFQQAIGRAAPESLVSIPTLIYGISVPNTGEAVMYNYYAKSRSRTILQQEAVDFRVQFPRTEVSHDVYPEDDDEVPEPDETQSGLSEFTDN